MNIPTDPTNSEDPWFRRLAAAWFFCILLAYSLVRPIREMFGSLGDAGRLANLMLLTVAVMLVAVPLYGWLVNRLPRRWLVRCVYHFFAASLIVFAASNLWVGDSSVWLSTTFFVWVNVFGLFATSVFWSVLVDLRNATQAKRDFGFVAAGGTTGAIVGSLLMTQLPLWMPRPWILAIAAVVVEIGLVFAWRLGRPTQVASEDRSDAASANQSVGSGSPFDGVAAIFRSPYLMMICLYLFLAQGFGTLLYFLQNDIVSASLADIDRRTSFFASLDLGTQILTLLIQSLATPWLLANVGLAAALMLLPAVYAIGLPALAWLPTLPMLAAAMIAARSVGYGVTVPSREVLFALVPRQQKYKSKSVIDTVVLRGSDAIASQLMRVLVAALIPLAAIAATACAVAMGFAGVGWALAKQAKARGEKSVGGTDELASVDVDDDE